MEVDPVFFDGSACKSEQRNSESVVSEVDDESGSMEADPVFFDGSACKSEQRNSDSVVSEVEDEVDLWKPIPFFSMDQHASRNKGTPIPLLAKH